MYLFQCYSLNSSHHLLPPLCAWGACVCVCVCVCERERERDREMWTIFKACIEFVTMAFWPGDTWDETHIPCTERWSLNHWNIREVQIISFYMQLYQHHFQSPVVHVNWEKKNLLKLEYKLLRLYYYNSEISEQSREYFSSVRVDLTNS